MSETDGAWLVLKDKDEPELPAESISSSGQEAVMLKKCKPGNYISVNILPAARITDDVKKTINYEKDFYVQLYCLSDDWSVISEKSYSSDEALKLASRFVGLTKDRAIKVWNMRKLGSEGNRIELL
ncbi:hypothetical protein [Marinibactrum halimedae]|nr:hypothetical protein [Marinibactrum halimedae]MCD9461161.1 hypothetical protein [Marinibactrum halimedae]MCD9461167.1 hypothetical protein [Marinibactrum halimedae]